MSPEIALSRFVKKVKEAAEKTLTVSDEDLEDFLFSIWLEAIHEALIGHGCACQTGDKDNCFLNQPKEKQLALTALMPILNFPNFVALWRKARLAFLAQTPSEELPRA